MYLYKYYIDNRSEIDKNNGGCWLSMGDEGKERYISSAQANIIIKVKYNTLYN